MELRYCDLYTGDRWRKRISMTKLADEERVIFSGRYKEHIKKEMNGWMKIKKWEVKIWSLKWSLMYKLRIRM